MRFPKLTKSMVLILFANTLDVFAQENVCQNKYWLQSPILETKSGDSSGIGGTGFSLPTKLDLLTKRNGEDESGIGGTGIVGIISGFGSICVNGLEIQYDSTTPVVEEGVSINVSQLALGQTVSILASSVTQNYYAKEIHVFHEVKGVVESVDSTNGIFSVLGQTVHLPVSLLEKITLGDKVVISGNRLSDGSIEAVRVEKHDVINDVSLIGSLEADNASGHFRIGNQSIELSENQAEVKIGDEVRVQGVLNGNVLRAEKLEQNPRWSFSSRVDQLLLQGYVRQSENSQINIDGMKINVNEATDKTPKRGEHTGIWVRKNEEGRMDFDHLEIKNSLPEHDYDNHLREQLKTESTSKIMHEKPERNTEFKDQQPIKPGFYRSDMYKPAMTRLEINHLDIEKPTLLRPEINRPDIDKPTLLRLENYRPEINRPNVQRPERLNFSH